mgnify:CR=1 FL=1|tara:strand:+ start:76 stop:363 length:288 start_codon:yes stop_codon:yes gene_type:complete
MDVELKSLNDEVSFYWERDNSRNFVVTDPEGNTYNLLNVEGSLEWTLDTPPEKLRLLIENWVNEKLWDSKLSENNPVMIIDGIEIREFLNETFYM